VKYLIEDKRHDRKRGKVDRNRPPQAGGEFRAVDARHLGPRPDEE
jgi:hypothetical protein